MDAIEKIVQQILAKGQAEITELRHAEKTRIDEAHNERLVTLQELEKQQIAKNKQAIEKEFHQKRNRQQLDVRQSVLNQKQAYLVTLFEEAVTALESQSTEELQAFAEQALKSLNLAGAVVVPGAKSAAALTAAWLTNVNQKLGTTYQLGATVSGEAGFIVEQEGVEYNFLFTSLVREIQETESFQVAERLFR